MSKKKTDEFLEQIADYVYEAPEPGEEAMQTARACLADSLGCAILALQYPACTKLLGPIVSGTIVPNGCRIPGTEYVLDPVRGAFNLGTMIRWLDYNDTWLAAEWGHPSDNIGGILTLMDYLSRQNKTESKRCFSGKELLLAIIKAHEIQGVIALSNSFNRIGFDHVILVKIATSVVAAWLLGATKKQIIDTLSNAWIDTGPLRTYRHAPNTGSRKSWAAGDATSRGVQLALMTMQGEMGYPLALSTQKWGFYDVLFQGKPMTLTRPLGSYVMENVLFKISFPAEFHAQTAVECAIKLHAMIGDRLQQIKTIQIQTHESAIRIIDKKGPLHNPADRDHCLQYMAAIGLIYGYLNAEHYEEEAAENPLIDALREKMVVTESKQFSRDYLDPEKRSIANSMTIHFKDGTSTPTVTVEYPIGHRRRRKEGLPLLFKKLQNNLSTRFSQGRVKQIVALFQDQSRLENIIVPTLVDLFIENDQE